MNEKKKKDERKKKKEFLESLERGVNQVNQHLRGEITLKTARDLLKEL